LRSLSEEDYQSVIDINLLFYWIL